MNLVDSCGWLEYFAGTANGDNFAPALENPESLIVPSITLHEVFKVILRQQNESDALEAVALMRQGKVVPLDERLALKAAKIGVEEKMPMADSIVYATGLVYGAMIWTQDADFRGKPGVWYFGKEGGEKNCE